MRTKLSRMTEDTIKAVETNGKLLFPLLSNNDVKQFRAWTREHYRPGEPIPENWHPVVKSEAELINQSKK